MERKADRRALAAAAAAAVALVWIAWKAGSGPSIVVVPGEARPVAAVSKKAETVSGSASVVSDDPPGKRWPRLKSGIELLERNRHREAAAFFAERARAGGLEGEEAGMAVYFQAEALFALDRLKEAEPLYRTVTADYAYLPAADNARSALEYIAGSETHRKMLAERDRR